MLSEDYMEQERSSHDHHRDHKSQHHSGKTAHTESHHASAAIPGLQNWLLLAGIAGLTAGLFLVFTDPPVVPEPPKSSLPGAGGMPHQEIALPQSLDSLIQIGNLFYDERNFAMAAEAYGRALQLNGELIDVRTDYGASLHAMGMPMRAREEFSKVIAAKPDHAVATFNLGIVFRSLNQADSARHYWEATARLASGTPLGDTAAVLARTALP